MKFKQYDSVNYNCYTFVQEYYKEFGIELPHFSYIFNLVNREDKIQDTISNLFIRLDKPKPNCLVTISLSGKYTDHIGVVLEDCFRFIHNVKGFNVIVSNLKDFEVRGFYEYSADKGRTDT